MIEIIKHKDERLQIPGTMNELPGIFLRYLLQGIFLTRGFFLCARPSPVDK